MLRMCTAGGGVSPFVLIAFSRNPSGAAARAVQAQGIEVTEGGGLRGGPQLHVVLRLCPSEGRASVNYQTLLQVG